jgi:NTP pyrophosphatase (non-canonical NTP hydrolase)
MDANEYQKRAMRTHNKDVYEIKDMLNNAALGLTGESGEFADHIKKMLFQGHEIDKTYLINELGDIIWYCSLACTATGVAMGEVMKNNIAKLEKRYPVEFERELSINRKNEVKQCGDAETVVKLTVDRYGELLDYECMYKGLPL